MHPLTILILIGAAMFGVLGLIPLLAHIYNLNGIKSKTVGDGRTVRPGSLHAVI